jgi:hypothetical protein
MFNLLEIELHNLLWYILYRVVYLLHLYLKVNHTTVVLILFN